MSSDTTPQAPEPRPNGRSDLTEQSRPDLAEEVYRLKQETNRLNDDVIRLRGRSSGLIGLIMAIIVLFGGVLGWFLLRLQAIDQQASTEVTDRIEQLEKQIAELNRQIPADFLEAQEKGQALVKQLETQLAQLKAQLRRIGLSVPDQGPWSNDAETQPDSPEPEPSIAPPEPPAPSESSP